MAATYPAGYGQRRDTMQEVRDRHRADYHPEAWRRIEAVMVASEGVLGLAANEGMLGIGGGARTREEQARLHAKYPSTFAPPDRSFHQVWEWSSGAVGAQAVDWVGSYGRHGEAWRWLRDHGGRFGLKTFWNVNGEPWHSQMLELPNSVSQWLSLGRPDPSVWDLGSFQPVPDDYGTLPLNPAKPTIMEGSLGHVVEYAQRVMRDKASQDIAVDGEFGPQTRAAVCALQRFFSTEGPAGVVNKDEWDIIDALVGVHHDAPKPPVAPDSPERVDHGLYLVRQGDSPYRVESLVYGGTGAEWAEHFSVEQFSEWGHRIQLPDLPGVVTKVLPGEGAYATIKRMYPAHSPYDPGRLRRFHDLNGGPNHVLHPGDIVFLDAP